MKIIKGNEPIAVQHPVFLVFGQPGICKSSLGFSMADPLSLDFDQGAHRAVNRRDTLVIESWAAIDELMKNPAATLQPYASIVIDTVGRSLDQLSADIAIKEPKKAPGGNLSQQGWGTLKTRFKQWITTMRALGKDVLLIAHDKEDKDGDTRIVRPEIVGGSYGEVMKIADFVGYCYMSGRDRILDFNPTDRWIGKNPGGWEPFKVPPAAKATTFMAELYAKGREALGQISAASANATNVVDHWRTVINTMPANAKTFNDAIEEVKKLQPPIVLAQVAQVLLEVGQQRGLTFDKPTKKFVDAAPQLAVPASDIFANAFE